MKGLFLTDTGQVRSHNEDSGGIFYNASGQLMAVIADGMGGHQAGDVASQMATAFLKEEWATCSKLNFPDEAEAWLTKTVMTINEKIFQHALQNEACFGMGTTIVIAICIDDIITVAHIGDSRCYILNDNGFKQITEDHSLVNALVQSGQISKDDALSHPRKNVVLKALGTEEEIDADIQTLGLEQGDKILLCTDGLTDKVLDNELLELIQSPDNINAIGEKMIELANNRGGEDNISLIIIHHDPSPKEGEQSC
ncbi:protein phosphatase [Virgibacillus profundi]|uniref:protein-serine/threonine phosphatase n=1 Tax=Virgibacillus profundi TaxID=2024555 RepID=A0A2A2IFU3_9BACI|nr:Stp1/IreP family PP2C-type Ser/Thr phosphatase [Virgibacillus profundi]PAV29953.1 protein phosphatase [Virgibacillus profundi]PXY54125.1 Stp1/IreP family PP2C-type Ser/Thr phosphatase [Virgibacillus profundi]